MEIPELPDEVAEALALAGRLGMLAELGKAIASIVSGDLERARLSAEEAAIKAAARLPYELKK